MKDNTELMTSEVRIVRRKEIVTVDLDGEVGMMNVEKGKYFGLDEVGTSIWKYIEESIVVKELVSMLLEEYDIDEETCSNQTIDFLQKLCDHGLIQIVS